MSDTRFAIEVFIFGAKGFGGSLLFATPQVTIGRDPRSQVHLDDPSVSLRHAVLEIVGDSVKVRDLGSRAGTIINGRTISQQVTLQPTDELLIGTYRLRLTIHRPEAAQGPSSSRARAIAVPTPLDAMPVPGERLARPATQRIESLPKASPSVDDEVTTTGVVLPKAPPQPLPPPQAPLRALDDEPSGSGPLDIDQEETAARPLGGPAESMFNPVPGRSFFDVMQPAPREPAAREPVPRTQPPAAPVAPARAPMGGATVPLSFSPAMLRPAREEALPARPPSTRPPPKEPTLPRTAALAMSQPPVLPFAGRAADYDDDDDDEDDDSDFVPPFDLLQALTRAGTHSDLAGRPVAVEAIHFREDRILAIRHVKPGEKLRVAGLQLGSRDASGAFVLDSKLCTTATVRQDGRRLPPEEAEVLGANGLTVVAGMQVVVQLAHDDSVLVQIVPQVAALAPVKVEVRPMLERLKPGAASVGVHLLLLVFFGITMLRGKNAIADDVNEGRFATINLQPVEIEPPPPKELPPSVDKSITVPSHVARHDPSAPAKSNAKVPEHTSDQPAKPNEESANASSILKALGGAPASTPEISALNMDAMPRGRSGFRVSDAVGKGPGDNLRVGVGNADGTINTKSTSELGNVGKLDVKPGTGAVRARVSAVPAGVSGEGHLDRGAIQRVVNAHLYQVQGCYERQLAANPNLAGKATFQWTISTSGSVSGVRIAGSSIASVEVMSCIQGAIRGWSFPKPEGGSVTVTYPFAFTTFGN
jgi:predicted component of type VI protein secretion system